MDKSTIIVYREDVNTPLHPYLFDDWLETLGIDPNAEQICLELSSHDSNKKA